MGRFQKLISSTLAAISLLINCSCQQIADKFDEFSGQISPIIENISESVKTKDTDSFTEFIDPQSDEPYIILNDNLPEFDTIEITTDEFERYSELDDLGRCGVAYANISLYTMPTEEREGIGMIKPSGTDRDIALSSNPSVAIRMTRSQLFAFVIARIDFFLAQERPACCRSKTKLRIMFMTPAIMYCIA